MDKGEILNERYEVKKTLSQGGFGITYLAQDITEADRPLCVIKKLQLRTDIGLNMAEAETRFQREAETLKQLGNHAQIPQFWDYFIDGDEFYLVQEYIDGQDLRGEITDGKRWSQGKVIGLLYDVLQILKFIQGQNPPIIHRDINPRNLIKRKSDRRIVLIDFGAVKEVVTTSEGETSSTIVIGTPDYTPEEQKRVNPLFRAIFMPWE